MHFGLNIIMAGRPPVGILCMAGGPLELRGYVAARGSWLLLFALQLIFLRLLGAGFTLTGAKLMSCACVWIIAVACGDLKGPATAANNRYSARSTFPLIGHAYGAVVRPHNHSSTLELRVGW
jgi:hypothetical protein